MDYWRSKLSDMQRNTVSMYTGNQNREIYRGVTMLRQIAGVEVDYFIVSAGFGVLCEGDQIPPYDCSFTGMKVKEIDERAKKLKIPQKFMEIQYSDYDLMYLALGSNYLRALGSDWVLHMTKMTICFQKKYESNQIVSLPADARIVKAYSNAGHKIHGVAGFKGDLLRILVNHALNQDKPLAELESWTDMKYFCDTFYSLGNIAKPMKNSLVHDGA